MITKKLISRGLDSGIIRFTNSPDDGSVVCKIGEYWFYFIGSFNDDLTTQSDPCAYVANTPFDEIVNDIFDTLQDFLTEGWEAKDEYDYYEAVLRERIV